MAAATSDGPPLVGVGTRVSPRTSWSESTMTAWIFVPPRSMPPRMARAYPPRAMGSPRIVGAGTRTGEQDGIATAARAAVELEVGSTMGA